MSRHVWSKYVMRVNQAPLRPLSREYGWVMNTRGSAWILYTVWRVVFFIAAWLLIQLTTPVRGWWAIALAIVVSAIFSILLLGRQRDAMSGSVYGFFKRINQKIDAAAAKEDFDDPPVEIELPAEGQSNSTSDSVDEEKDSGRL